MATDTTAATASPRMSRSGRQATRRGSAPHPATSVLKTRQHRPGYIALLLALVVGLGLAGGWLYQSAGAKATVLVMATDIDAGQVITREDLTTVSLAGEARAITADQVSTVVGKRARVPLLSGTLLQRSMLGAAAALPEGHVLVGVLLPAGAAPAGGLVAGDLVDVYRLPAASARDEESTAPMVVAARVAVQKVASASKEQAVVSSGLLVTLVVPTADAAAVVAANGAKAVAVVVVGP